MSEEEHHERITNARHSKKLKGTVGPPGADVETAEGDEDTEGHSKTHPGGADAETAEGDDTEDTTGHQRKPRA
jgi:hypothetical protein